MEKNKNQKTVKQITTKKMSPGQTLNALERCRAVLSIWAERRKPSQVCRELSIQMAMLNHWQQRALEGMLQALEPRTKLAQGAALSPRLQSLLERKQQTLEKRQVRSLKLETRLSSIQDTKNQGSGQKK